MIINNKGAIIYEVGDTVLLPSIRPRNWSSSGEMDRYLGRIVTLTIVNYGEINLNILMELSKETLVGSIGFSGSSGWSFRTDEIECIATPEAIAEIKAKKERELAEFKEKFKHFVSSPDEIFAIAKEAFGEEHVDMNKVSETDFALIVLFPELRISNSRRQSLIIRDLYVKIDIEIVAAGSPGDRVSNITLSGRRGMLSQEEYQSNYGHSHFSGNGMDRWSEFCLGTSDFAMIINTMKYSITQEDWDLLFLSLENYVSWESLEGGPYRNLSNVSIREQSVSTSSFRDHALELIKELPSSCLTFNSKRIELNIDHPELLQYYTSNSRIKSFRSTSSATSFSSVQTRFNDYVRRECRPFTFKGNDVVTVLYNRNGQSLTETTPDEQNLDQEVINFYNTTINKELKKFNIQYEHKKLSYSNTTIFREAVAFQ